GVEGVVDDPFGGVLLMVILEAQMTKTLGNRLQSWPLGLFPECIVSIRAADNLAQQHQGRITRQVVLLEDGLKRAFFAMMPQFHIFHVIGNSPLSFSYLHHLIGRNEQELGILIDKFLDEPGAGYTVYFDAFTGNPLHRIVLLAFFTLGSARSRAVQTAHRR